MQDLAGDSRVDMRFGIDRAGELYVLAKANGKAWKVTGTRGSASQVHPSLEPTVFVPFGWAATRKRSSRVRGGCGRVLAWRLNR